MSAFTPGDQTGFTERCDQAQDDRGKEHQDLEEHQDTQLQEDNSYRCERDTGDRGGNGSKICRAGHLQRPGRPGRDKRPENPRKHGGNEASDTGEPRAGEGTNQDNKRDKGCKKPANITGRTLQKREQERLDSNLKKDSKKKVEQETKREKGGGQPGAGRGAAPGSTPAAATAPTLVATTHWPIPGRWRPTTTAQ